MTTEEAIKTLELAISEVEWEYPMDYAAAIDEAILALREKAEAEKNEPLTLEELREMDGEPVCIAPVDGGPYTWMLVDTEYEVCREAHGGLAVFENFNKTWVAYRRRPKEAHT